MISDAHPSSNYYSNADIYSSQRKNQPTTKDDNHTFLKRKLDMPSKELQEKVKRIKEIHHFGLQIPVTSTPIQPFYSNVENRKTLDLPSQDFFSFENRSLSGTIPCSISDSSTPFGDSFSFFGIQNENDESFLQTPFHLVDQFNENTEGNDQSGALTQNSSFTGSLSSSTVLSRTENLLNESRVLEGSAKKAQRKKGKGKPWSHEEESQLIKARKQSDTNWDNIIKLVPGRTKKQCQDKLRWLKEHNDPRIDFESMQVLRKKTEWSPDEENQLIEARQKFDASWDAIAKLIPGKTSVQCKSNYHLLKQKKDPRINLESSHVIRKKWSGWSHEEVRKLIEAMQKYGHHWNSIAKLIPGKTSVQCSSKYQLLKKHEDPRLSFKLRQVFKKEKIPWSQQEENQLIDARQKCGTNWGNIIKFVPGRTKKQCQDKLRLLKKRKDPRMDIESTHSMKKNDEVNLSDLSSVFDDLPNTQESAE